MEISTLKTRLAKLILERCFRYADRPIFKLASGRMSQYYFNCKPVTMSPEGMYLIGELIFHLVSFLKPDAIGGLTLGADPIAYAVCLTSYLKGTSIKAFTVRKEPKGHGTKQWIEGDIKEGERVVIVEDVVTTGGSTIKAITRAQASGLEVIKVVTLIDREEGGKEAILQYTHDFESIFTRSEFIQRKRRLKGKCRQGFFSPTLHPKTLSRF